MSLFIAVCPPSSPKKDPRFEVWLADGINKGTHVASCVEVETADRICVTLAMVYRCRALPMGPSSVTGGEARPR